MANIRPIDLERGSSQSLSITDGSQTGLHITSDMTIELWSNWESITNGNLYNPMIPIQV